MLISTKLAYIPTFKVVDVSEFVFRVFLKTTVTLQEN